MTTADRTLFWFCHVYGLDFADAERMAAYELLTDAGHATRVSILMNCDKISFDAALAIVSQTDAEFDREELMDGIDFSQDEPTPRAQLAARGMVMSRGGNPNAQRVDVVEFGQTIRVWAEVL